MFPDRLHQRGIGLIEMVMTIMILGIALAAVVSSMSSMAARSADPLIQDKAVALAQAYMDEILSKRYDHNSPAGGGAATPSLTACASLGPETGETRATYNDVDDYHNLTDSPPRDQDGNLLPGYQGFSVNVQVTCHGNEFGTLGINNSHAKRIDIIVTPPGQQGMAFSIYRGYY